MAPRQSAHNPQEILNVVGGIEAVARTIVDAVAALLGGHARGSNMTDHHRASAAFFWTRR